MKKLSYLIHYAIVRAFARFVNFLPFPLALFLARPVGVSLSYMLKRKRDKCVDNLHHAFGIQKSEKEISRITRESFVHMAEFAVEWFRLPQIARIPERYLSVNNEQKIHEALKQGKGAIILASHNGNWEIMSLIVGLLIAKPVGVPIYALARPQKNSFLYDYTLRLRGLTGLKSIDKRGGARATFRHLKNNNIVCILMDQRVREGSVEATFFGRKALTTSLPAIAARRLGTPVFYVFLKRMKGLRYVMNVEGPIPMANVPDRNIDLALNTQRFNDLLEVEIRKDPSQWLWTYSRWKGAEN